MTARYGYALVSVGAPLQECALDEPALGEEDVVVEVAGCGVCHTDISFAKQGVPTRQSLPLILGHEIAGKVVATGAQAEEWMGTEVLVPAVIPCGTCPACEAGHPTVCRDQYMPGNDGNGGFATHVVVPSRGLCRIPAPLPSCLALSDLSVVADALTTPYEAIRRSNLKPGDVAVFIGVGGVGGFGVQVAHAFGAHAIAIDIDAERLNLLTEHGASATFLANQHSPKDLKKRIRSFAKEVGSPSIGTKIFECSGTTSGQELAFSLLDHRGYLGIVGYTPDKISLRLSNVMAFDAVVRGNWGCRPDYYPRALDLVIQGQVAIAPFIERHPLREAPEVLEAVASHTLKKRPVLVPQEV